SIEWTVMNPYAGLRDELSTQRPIAGNRPRSQQRQPLPGRHPRSVITVIGFQRICDVAAFPLRTQPQVDAIHVALTGEILQTRGDSLRQPPEIFRSVRILVYINKVHV